MFASRKACLGAACLLLTSFAACDRQYDSNDFLPSAPAVQKALQIVLEALSVPADGAATVRIEAQISPDADADKRRVRFQTTLGSWVDPDPEQEATDGQGNPLGAGQQAIRDADTAGKAAAFLKSGEEAGVALITVSVLDEDGNPLATVSGEVTFTRVTGALELSVDTIEAAADGKSEIALEAQISAESPQDWDEVDFSTTLGKFAGSATGTPTKITVKTDGNRIARALLTSTTVGTATVRAEIKDFKDASVSQLVEFVAGREISVDPDNLDFGEVTENTTSDRELRIGNHGTVPMTVTGWTPNPGDAGFSVALAPPLDATVLPGGSVGITVRFTAPAAPATKTAVLEITSDDPIRGTLKVALAGVSVKAEGSISVSPGSLAFGQVKNGTNADKSLTITNTGTAALNVGTLAFTNARFSLFGTAPSSIAAGASVPITVRFSPNAVQPESGVLSIPYGDPQAGVVAVDLTGEGIP